MKAPAIVALLLMALALTGCNSGPTTIPAPAQTPAQAAPQPQTPAPSKALKSGTYKGKVARGYGIEFELSADGKQVTKLHADVLESCTTASTSRTTTVYFDGPFAASADGSFNVEGEEKEYEIIYRFTATFTPDGRAKGTILQSDPNCTTYELEWEAERQ